MKEYKKLVLRLESLAKEARASLYERITLANQIFSDEEFRSDRGLQDDWAAAKELDAYFQPDTGFKFLDLRSLVEHFPFKNDWETTSLRHLWDRMIDEKTEAAKAAEKSAGTEKVKKRHVIKQSVYKEAVQQVDKLKAEVKTVNEKADNRIRELGRELNAEISKLRDENEFLKKENARLEAENERLWRLISERSESKVA